MREQSRTTMRERGFSMIELMVAMVITLLIMGSVYGMLAGGQNAFRREPELAERQQNIRMAMDIIMRDVANAASGLPTFVQTFTPGLNACTGCPNGGAPMGPDGVRTDEIEILTNSESRDTEPFCRRVGLTGNDVDATLMRGFAAIPANTHVIPFTANGQWTLRNVVSTPLTPDGPVPGPTDCAVGNHTEVNLLQSGDTSGLNTATTACEPNGWGNTTRPCELVGLSFANIVRYRIRMDTSVPPVPMLERWSSDAPGSIVANAPQGFQTLARGIENMQIQYLRANGNPNLPADWLDSPPAVTPLDYTTLVTQVRVTLASRSEAQNIAGATTSVSGGNAIRGTMTSSASPRATLMNISLAPQPSPPASPMPPLLWR